MDDKRVVQRALRELPDQIKVAREKEMGEMMSKMKDVSCLLSNLKTISRRLTGI